MPDSALTTSVVICTRDRHNQLSACLAAVADAGASEIVVVDNAPKVGAVDVASRYGARYVCELRLGLSRARNRGAAEARSEIVVYLDDDAIPQPGWLAALAHEFVDPRVGIVFGRVLPPSDTDSELVGLYNMAYLSDPGVVRKVVDRDSPDWFERVVVNALGGGGNMAVRRSAFRVWRGFDERIGCGTKLAGHEETRALATLVDLGFRAIYAPGAVVTHPVPPKSAVELKKRCLQGLHATGGYLVLLLMEEPAHRRAVCRYILRKLRHGWACKREVPGPALAIDLPRSQVLIARLQGAMTYLCMRWISCRE